ncbi:uncharacterized protein LOC62_02G003433 [Vanrija pseudolonga]|uniref:Ricin B lectin domain-containing protein n=1 Tax=Vanrija pseudolonga TaxID=143232 RepID=A0AAF1BKR8_9TREE|nr:hypothetical protein LOC62_02G003433 [Vanrija pseudolonga]
MLFTALALTLASLVAATPVDNLAPRAPGHTYTALIHPKARQDLCIKTASKYYGGSEALVIGPCAKSLSIPPRFIFTDGKTRVRVEGYNYCLQAGVENGHYTYSGDGTIAWLGICPPEGTDATGFEWNFANGRLEQINTNTGKGRPNQCLDNTDGANYGIQMWTCYEGNMNQQWVADEYRAGA